MGRQYGYKKYMKKEAQKDNSFLKIFIMSFFGMLILFTFLIKSFSPTVDTTIGNNMKNETEQDINSENIDRRLSAIQEEDQGKSFTELVSKTEENSQKAETEVQEKTQTAPEALNTENEMQRQEPIYKVFIGSYTSAEQAKVARDIIQESGSDFNPIVKCIGSNNYTLQVGIFKNKQSAEALLYSVQQNHLPGRIVQDYQK